MISHDDQRHLGFHGRLESNIEGKVIIKTQHGDILITTCVSKELLDPIKSNSSKANCPHIEVEQDIFTGTNTHCLNYQDCKKEFYFICIYDLHNKNNEDVVEATNSNLVYTDTLQDYQQDPKMSYVMNSFLAIAHGLNKVHRKVFLF